MKHFVWNIEHIAQHPQSIPLLYNIKLPGVLGEHRNVPGDGFIGEFRNDEASLPLTFGPDRNHASASVLRDQQCSQHCWACAMVTWPWSSSVTLNVVLVNLAWVLFRKTASTMWCHGPAWVREGGGVCCVQDLISGGLHLISEATLSSSLPFKTHYRIGTLILNEREVIKSWLRQET